MPVGLLVSGKIATESRKSVLHLDETVLTTSRIFWRPTGANAPVLLLLSLALGALSGSFLSGCSSVEGQADHAEEKQGKEVRAVAVSSGIAQQLKFETVVVNKRQMQASLTVTGQIQPDFGKEVQINTRINGRVLAIMAQPGQIVQAGQILATIDSQQIGDIEAELIEAKSRLKIAVAHEERERQIYEENLRRPKSLIEAKTKSEDQSIQLKLAQAEYNRQDGLYKEKIYSAKDYLIAQGNLQRAEAANRQAASDTQREESLFKNKAMMKKDLQLAEANTASARKHLNTLRQKLMFLGITQQMVDVVLTDEKIGGIVPVIAPVDGVLTHQDVSLGEVVTPEANVFTVTDLTYVSVSADIPEADLKAVKIGSTVKVKVSSYPDEEFLGTVNYMSTRVNPDTRTVPIRARLVNPSLKLKSNMFAEIEIDQAPVFALVCPKSAIQDHDGQKVAYVAGDDGYHERQVKLGRQNEADVEIVDGVADGERVVTKGSLLLKQELATAH